MRLRPRHIVLGIGGIVTAVTTMSAISSLNHNEGATPVIGREVFGGIPSTLRFEFYFVIIAALVACTALFMQRFANIERGQSESRNGMRRKRIDALYRTLMMKTVAQDHKAGVIHGLIYWSFLVLTGVTTILEIDHQLPNGWHFLHGGVYQGYAMIGDIAGALLLIGVIAAASRRYLAPPKRIATKTRPEDAWILLLLGALSLTGFLTEATRIAYVGRPSFEHWSIIGYPLATLFSRSSSNTWHQVSWSLHIVVFVGFLITLPVTKLRHAVTAPANAYLSPRERPPGEVRRVPSLLEGEVDSVGASLVSQFTWKQLLDTDACTTCGRCTSVCPANQTGKKLDPREIVLKIGSVMASSAAGGPISPTVSGHDIATPTDDVTSLISAEEVFACTTCKACDEVCPVEIEIMDKIIDIRRHYTLMESEFPTELGSAFVAMENSENPWGMPALARLDWTQGLPFDVTVVSETEPFAHDYLYWVGCAGSFDDRAKQTTRAVARLLNHAGVDFAMLGPSERCTGDPARRAGNEYLFQMLATQNIAMLNGMGVQKIVTNCPHCFNTLANEYTAFGGKYDVIHHSQLLRDLAEAGRFKLKNVDDPKQIVFHDSCYLTRHNGESEAPRKVVGSLKGIQLIEAPRNRENAFCCGAGGAQMWMEEGGTSRVNVERSTELLATGASEIAVACPFCAVMIDDGVKAQGSEIPVRDIALVLAEALID